MLSRRWTGQSMKSPALIATGEDESTLTFFTSDNDTLNKDFGQPPAKRREGADMEGGWREPALVRWPGRIAPGTVTQAIASTMDIHPTIMSLAGFKPPSLWMNRAQ